MERVAQIIKLLSDVDRHEHKLGVILIAPGLKNAGDGQIFWQNNLAQFIERFLFVCALRVFEILNLIENLSEVSGGINGQLVANIDAQDAGEITAEHGRFAVEIELTFFNELANRNHFFFLGRVDPSHHRRQSLVLEFNNDRALNERRGRDHVRRVVDLLLKCSPVAHHVLAFHKNVRVKIDYFLPQLAIETGHHRNHENQHSHAKRDTDDRNQSDDGQKCTFRFEITQREKKTERQFQVAVMLAANATVYNPAGCRA